MGSAYPKPIRIVEDLHLLENEQDKCKQELRNYEEEINLLKDKKIFIINNILLTTFYFHCPPLLLLNVK